MSSERETPNSDQLARVGEEIKAGTWLANARGRAQRRKSAWNLLLPLFGLPFWAICVYGLVAAGHDVHSLLRGASSAKTLGHFFYGPMRPATFLILIPSFLAGVAPALLLANLVVYQVRPARRAMDLEDSAYPGTDYAASQSALLRMAAWGLLLWVACVLVASIFP